MPWSCRVDAERGEVFFVGEEGRIRAKVFRGRIPREMEHGLLALRHERALSYLRREWDVRLLDSGRLLLSGGGWHAEIQPLRGATIPRTLLEALTDVFVRRKPQGSRNEQRRAAASVGGKRSGEVRRAKSEEPKVKKPRRPRRTRGRMSLEERRALRAARKAEKAQQTTAASSAAQGEQA